MTKSPDPTRSMADRIGDIYLTSMGASALQAAKRSLADSVEDLLETSPFCSRVALADSVEDPLEASPLCSKVALADAASRRISE